MWKQRTCSAIQLNANIILFGDEGIGKKTTVFQCLEKYAIKYATINCASENLYSYNLEDSQIQYIVLYNSYHTQIETVFRKRMEDPSRSYIFICNGGPEKVRHILLEYDCIQILCTPPGQAELMEHVMRKKSAAIHDNAYKLVQYLEGYTHRWRDAEYLSDIILPGNLMVYTEFAINNLGICKYNEKTLIEDYTRYNIYKMNNHQQDTNTQICLEGLNELEKIIIVSAVIASYGLQSNDIKCFGKYEVKKSRASNPRQICRRFPAERLYAICEYFCELQYIDSECVLMPGDTAFSSLLQDLCEKGYIKLYKIKSKVNDLCSVYYKSNVSINQAIKIGQILNIKLEEYINNN